MSSENKKNLKQQQKQQQQQQISKEADEEYIKRRAANLDRRLGLSRRRGPGARTDERKCAEEGKMTDEQFEFLMAIDQYKREYRRPFPSWIEVLELIKTFGYRKVGKPQVAKVLSISNEIRDMEVESVTNEMILERLPFAESTTSVTLGIHRYSWSLKFVFPEPTTPAKNICYLLWSFCNALDTIQGASVVVEDWGKGSVWAKMRVYLQTTWDRDEIAKILDLGRKRIKGDLEKPFAEKIKLEAEAKKIEEETNEIKNRRSIIPNKKESKEQRLLDLESQRLDNQKKLLELESLGLDNERKAIEIDTLKLDAIQKASELVAKGILSVDKVKIEVNDLFYFSKENNKIREGSSIEVISDNEFLIIDEE